MLLIVDPLLLEGWATLFDHSLGRDGELGGQLRHRDLVALVPLVRLRLQGLSVGVVELLVLLVQQLVMSHHFRNHT